MTVEKQARAASGWPMLFVTLVAYAAAIWGMIQGIVILATAEEAGVPAPVAGPALLVGGIVLLIVAIIVSCGFFSLQPGQARVLVLFLLAAAGPGPRARALWQLRGHRSRVRLLLGEPLL